MKVTLKDILFGVIIPIILTVVSIIYADNIKTGKVVTLQSILNSVPFVLIFLSIWFWGKVVIKRTLNNHQKLIEKQEADITVLKANAYDQDQINRNISKDMSQLIDATSNIKDQINTKIK
jgi:hypothetical protein